MGTMSAAPQPNMLQAALAAYDAGLCVVRAATDGSKRPLGGWKQYQSERPTREQVANWFANGHQGMGTICGAVSGDLEMFELEGRFVDAHTTGDFLKRMKDAGLELLLKRLTNGMLTASPTNGRHFIYRVADGEVDGNTKLASNANHETLIETRGEGGFVMLPPSHGTTHPSGKAWDLRAGGFDTIPTITAEEREALFAVARTYDEAPAPLPITPVAPSARIAHTKYQGVPTDSWYDAVDEHLARSWDMQALLERYGWEFCYQDRRGRRLMHRPGKDGDGVSGSINLSDRFHPFSSSTPFPGATAGKRGPTFKRLDIIAIYEHGGDRDAAARSIAESTGIMDAWRRKRDAELLGEPMEPPPTSATKQAPPNVNADGEIMGAPPASNDDAFWMERPALTHILAAARSRLVGPYAVLGCVLARVAAFTPPSTCLPPTIGGEAPLSLFVALRARSGGGKSSPLAASAALLPDVPPGCGGPLSLGSGEGLVEAFLEKMPDPNNAKATIKKQTRTGVLFTLDEGQMLAEIGSRKGATILPILRTAWSGGDPGQANASADTFRTLRTGSYHIGLISLWQNKSGAALIADADGGTPQRFVWLPTSDPGATKNAPKWPGRLDWTPPPMIAIGGVIQHTPLHVADEIVDEIRDAHIASNLHETTEENPLDAHRRLNKLKVAGCLAILDGRKDIDPDDWRLAEHLMTISDQQRDWVIAESRRAGMEMVSSDIARAVMKEGAIEKSAADRALKNAARAVWRAASSAADGAQRRDIHHRIASRDRALVTVDDAIAHALKMKWIEGNDTIGYRSGEVSPS